MMEVYTCECGAIADNPHTQAHHTRQATTVAQVITALQDRIERAGIVTIGIGPDGGMMARAAPVTGST